MISAKGLYQIRIGFLVLSTMVFFGIFAGVLAQMFGQTTAFTSWIANMLTKHNFNTVVADTFYRSGEMGAEELDEIIRNNNIKTIIDLRLDPNEKDDGSLSEKWISELDSAEYYNVKLSSSKIPSYETVSELIEIYDKAKIPILVHCSSGTHRTGFASFVWMLEKENSSVELASEQLSLKYGFIPLERKLKSWFQKEPTLDHVVWSYRDWTLKQRAEGKKQEDFRIWIKAFLSSQASAN